MNGPPAFPDRNALNFFLSRASACGGPAQSNTMYQTPDQFHSKNALSLIGNIYRRTRCSHGAAVCRFERARARCQHVK